MSLKPITCAQARHQTQEIYDLLREIARSRFGRAVGRGHTLQATAVAHEAWIRLMQSGQPPSKERHLVVLACTIIRQVLIDHARGKNAAKRGGGRRRIRNPEDWCETCEANGDVDLLDLHDALTDLAEFGPRQAQVVEMKFFGGLTTAEIADSLGLSTRTIENDWHAARAWLRDQLEC